jgi:CopG family transcriptional regulator, nickel-responsive regulator
VSDLVRLSISLEKPLMRQLERLVKKSGYANRSEFVRDMIRRRLVEEQWADERQEVVGTIAMVYDHHARQLSDKLVDIQHDYHDRVLAATHVHLSHDLCAEMIMIRGQAEQIREIVNRLRQLRGVLHAELAMSSTGEKLD